MLREEVSHGKVCDEQGKESFGDVLKFRSEQELTDEERLGWLSKDISFMGVLHVCRRGNLEKREESGDRKKKTSFDCWIFSRAQLSVMESRTSSKTRLLVVDGTFLSPEEEIQQILNERAQG